MLLLDNTRAQLRSALRLADLGDQAAARFAVLKVAGCQVVSDSWFLLYLTELRALQLLDENEEVLLHVFGGILPLTYELGALAPALMDDVRLGSAASQADQLVKVHTLLSPILYKQGTSCHT